MFVDTLIKLLLVHFLCDYPLQGDFLARAKNPNTPVPGVPWWQAMGAHCAIHGGGVYLVTGSVLFACAELFLHFFVDVKKCSCRLSYNQDQAIHIGFKVLIATLTVTQTL